MSSSQIPPNSRATSDLTLQDCELEIPTPNPSNIRTSQRQAGCRDPVIPLYTPTTTEAHDSTENQEPQVLTEVQPIVLAVTEDLSDSSDGRGANESVL
mgnify:FL=1